MDGTSHAEQMNPAVAKPGPHAGIGFREFVGIVASMMAMVALAIDTMLPALPAIGTSLGIVQENERQLIVTAFLLGLGSAQLIYGPLSDRFGRRPLLLFGTGAYVLFSIGVALAPSFGVLLAFRLLQGMSVAATRVVTISVVRDCYGGRQMARVMSLAFMVFLAIPVMAPSIGQFFLLFLPWRGLFWVLAAYGLFVLTWLTTRLPETLHPEYRRPVDVASIFSAIRRSLTARQAVGYMLAQTVISGALYGFINSVQQIFADAFHAPRLMPLVFAAIAGMMALASLINSRIVEKLGTRRVSHSALLGFVAIELGHFLIAWTGHETLLSFALFQATAMFCFGLSMANFGAMAMEPLAEVAGTAASVQGFVTTVGGALLGFGIGQSFDGTSLPMTAGFAVAGVVGLGIVFATEGGRLFHPRMGS
ncbi:multidrug effflux MFS transporter [Sphingomonas oligoaromativorans]|jgi:DHA1 family bicyclomycin/chloramphenicol resistance-like MFS transporter|uniref:multidrug effflux MFS transporter n=1 Tax=Sphingomonas oligoaromativorans TaxID=575322 RepID=UPI001422C73B|nr:multidrug effflux MFS transporter [Sphingomonas oligoaromativorans]NIJ33973.1 DHA1 family bicyclomycin/chloramphenicol resistance-like MFS transporter [Sphingomonas oligoaromativorans]